VGPPVLGVTLSGPGPKGHGVVVGEVIGGTAAEDAGLAPGDIITAFGGHSISRPADLSTAIQRVSPGDELPITVVREGQPLKLALRF
jgi:S1-C subfamily serine protease